MRIIIVGLGVPNAVIAALYEQADPLRVNEQLAAMRTSLLVAEHMCDASGTAPANTDASLGSALRDAAGRMHRDVFLEVEGWARCPLASVARRRLDGAFAPLGARPSIVQRLCDRFTPDPYRVGTADPATFIARVGAVYMLTVVTDPISESKCPDAATQCDSWNRLTSTQRQHVSSFDACTADPFWSEDDGATPFVAAGGTRAQRVLFAPLLAARSLSRLSPYARSEIDRDLQRMGGIVSSLGWAIVTLLDAFERRAPRFRLRFGLDHATDLGESIFGLARSFAARLSARVRLRRSMPSDALTIKTRHGVTVLLASQRPAEERANALLHELAHLALFHDANTSYACSSHRLAAEPELAVRFDRQEREADALATLWYGLFESLCESVAPPYPAVAVNPHYGNVPIDPAVPVHALVFAQHG